MKILWPILILMLWSSSSYAVVDPQVFREWEDRLQERLEEGLLKKNRLGPVAIVSVKASSTKDKNHILNRSAAVLRRVLTPDVLVCEPCLRPEWRPGLPGLYRNEGLTASEIQNYFKNSKIKPRSAIWLDGRGERWSYRIVEIPSGRILYSEWMEPGTDWRARSMRNFSRSRVTERKGRLSAISHHAWDLGLYPNFYFGYNFLNQWGSLNRNLSGIAVSFAGPTAGVGATYLRVLNMPSHPMAGVKFLVNLPAAIGSSLGGDKNDVTGEPYVAQLVIKTPMPGNFGSGMMMALAGSDGTFGLGVSW